MVWQRWRLSRLLHGAEPDLEHTVQMHTAAFTWTSALRERVELSLVGALTPNLGRHTRGNTAGIRGHCVVDTD